MTNKLTPLNPKTGKAKPEYHNTTGKAKAFAVVFPGG